MKKWLKITVLALLPVSAAVFVAVRQLDPDQHFGQKKHPLVAVPSASAAQASAPPGDVTLNDAAKASLNLEPKAQAAERRSSSSFNALILGLDSKGERYSRTDVILFAHVVPSGKQVTIVSIPRDTRVWLPDIGLTKINHAHLLAEARLGSDAGTEAAVQAVSDLLQVPIHYYVKMNFDGFIGLIDAIGGVNLDVQQDVYLTTINEWLPSGPQLLDGRTALALVRERFTVKEGDFFRQQEQTKIVKSLSQKLLSPSRLPELPGLVSSAKKDLVDTNFSDADLISLGLLFKGLEGKDIRQLQLPGKALTAQDPLVRSNLWYWEPDMDQVHALQEAYLQEP